MVRMKSMSKTSRPALWLFSLLCLLVSLNHLCITAAVGSQQGMAGFEQAIEPRLASMSKDVLALSPKEGQLGYVKRITDMVHLSTYQCNPTDFRLSVLDKTVMTLLNIDKQKVFLSEGILVANRFVCGLCSQRAFIAHKILRDNGVQSEMYGLEGHVVLRVTVDGVSYFTDPDYGVGPFTVGPGENIADVIKKVYATSSVNRGDVVAQIYATLGDNRPYANYMSGIYKQQAKVFFISNILYHACLAIGLAGLLLGAYRISDQIRDHFRFRRQSMR